MASVYTDHSGSVYYNHGDRTEDRALRSAYGKQGHICCFCCCDVSQEQVEAFSRTGQFLFGVLNSRYYYLLLSRTDAEGSDHGQYL